MPDNFLSDFLYCVMIGVLGILVSVFLLPALLGWGIVTLVQKYYKGDSRVP